MKNKYGILMFFMTILLLSACSKQQDIQRIKVEASIEGESPLTRVSLTPSALDLIARWQENDAIRVFLGDGATYADAGNNRLESVFDEGRKAIFYYSLPIDFRPIGAYRQYCFTIASYPAVCDWELHCNASIVRAPLSSFRAPVFFENSVTGSDSFGVFRHYGVYELLHVNNTSDSDITFSLCGFNVDTFWYRTKGAIAVPSMEFTVDSEAARNPVDKSETVTIPAHSSEIIVSWYNPNGHEISKAELVAEVDGTTVVTRNQLSSKIIPQIAHAYHMYVQWNGSDLNFTNYAGDLLGGSDVDAGGSGYDPVGEGAVLGSGTGFTTDDSGNLTGSGANYGENGSGALSGGGSGYQNNN